MIWVIIIAIVLFILFRFVIKNNKNAVSGHRQSFGRTTNDMTMKAIKEGIAEAVDTKGMEGLVSVIQMTYALNNAQVVVSYKGSELIVNMLEPDLVNQYYEIQEVINNSEAYSLVDVAIAKGALTILKGTGGKNIRNQNPEERALFKKAGVTKYTTQIDGNHISTLDYY